MNAAAQVLRAIPTVYGGVHFRSRLEARWAATFDALGWPWQYEPADLAGYIPDFFLTLSRPPYLVEIKPAMSWPELAQNTAKIDASGWHAEAILLGNAPLEGGLGLLRGRLSDSDQAWLPFHVFDCDSCGTSAFSVGSSEPGACRRGHPWYSAEQRIRDAWLAGGNATQWKRSGRR